MLLLGRDEDGERVEIGVVRVIGGDDDRISCCCEMMKRCCR